MQQKRRGPLTAIERAQRAEKISKMLSPYGISPNGIDYLAKTRNFSPETIAVRLNKMREAHVPFTGPVWKLSMPARHFDALIKRYAVFAGKPTEKINLARYLISEGIPVPSAKKLLQRKFRLREIMEKIQFLESIRLDPAIYGAIRIPPKIYANVLDVPLYLLKGAKRKGGLKTRALDPLEDAYAAKQLNGLFPKWREMQKIKSFRPATILKKVKAAELRGLTPTVYLLANYSVESIKEGRAKKAQYVAKGRREPKK